MRYMPADDPWAALGPVVERAKRSPRGQKPVVPDRALFEALLYAARAGIPWRDLPSGFGSRDAVYDRFRRWVASGGLKAPFESPTADPAFGEVRRVPIDSATARAHAHAAGARRRHKRSGPPGRRRPRASAGAGAG
jgi:putative transposase